MTKFLISSSFISFSSTFVYFCDSNWDICYYNAWHEPDFAPPKIRDKGLTGSSATSLHAKTFVVDGKRVFIGSLNFDPRSARLNTEMDMVIDHAEIAGDMRQELEKITPQYAYRKS